MPAIVLVIALGLQPPAPGPDIRVQTPQQEPARQRGEPNPPVAGGVPAVKGAPLGQPERTEPDQEATPEQEQTPPGGPEGASGPDWIMVFFTGVLAAFTFMQLRANWRMEQHFKTKERAYLNIAATDTGLVVNEPSPDGSQRCFVMVIATNTGNTPARITDTFFDVWAYDRPIPRAPHYDRSAQRTPLGLSAYLVQNASFRINNKITLHKSDVFAIQTGVVTGWVYGYVDYIDVFGVRHRAGYGLRIKRRSRQRIKTVDDETTKRQQLHALEFDKASDVYNYDIVRKRGEGIDWGDE